MVGGECVAVGGFDLGGLGVLVGTGDGAIYTCVGRFDVGDEIAEGVKVEVAVDALNLYEHKPGPVTPELKSFNASIIASASCRAESDNGDPTGCSPSHSIAVFRVVSTAFGSAPFC